MAKQAVRKKSVSPISQSKNNWRNPTDAEQQVLHANGCRCENWKALFVGFSFDPSIFLNVQFMGSNYLNIGPPQLIELGGKSIKTGITNTTIVGCEIGPGSAVHHVCYLSNTYIEEECVLFNIGELTVSARPTFGMGIPGISTKGEGDNSIEVINEAGTRGVYPHRHIIAADAFLASKYRDDAKLQQKIVQLTQADVKAEAVPINKISTRASVQHCKILKDVHIGPHAAIIGADKVQDATVRSSEEEPSRVGEGVSLNHAILGRGCQVLDGSRVAHVALGSHVKIKHGARVFHSIVGDNSTIACCEVSNSLIYPFHEQHHNNSFLIASLVMGQSNCAAGVTIGSNHNSRSADGEIVAGRGFWPGLCTTLKHNSKFASFTLLAKGDYPSEINCELPFSLLNNNTTRNRLEILPAYWWLYNMYALTRNAWKFKTRDKRMAPAQFIESETLAPDTAEEIIAAREQLEIWTAQAALKHNQELADTRSRGELIEYGRRLLSEAPDFVRDLTVLADGFESGRRQCVVIKPCESYAAYGQMLLYYAVKTILEPGENAGLKALLKQVKASNREKRWINLGGQLVSGSDVHDLKKGIKNGSFKNWEDVHLFYHQLWRQYPEQKRVHACHVLLCYYQTKKMTNELLNSAFTEADGIQQLVYSRVIESRKKDFSSPFRKMTFDTEAEMDAVVGVLEKDAFFEAMRNETARFSESVRLALKQV